MGCLCRAKGQIARGIVLVLVLALGTSVLGQGIEVIGARAEVVAGTLAPGKAVDVALWVTLSAPFSCQMVSLRADLVVAGDIAGRVEESLVALGPGEEEISLGALSWPCGSSVELRNLVLSWVVEEGEPQTALIESLRVLMPPVADVAAGSPVCVGSEVLFADRSAGGAAPLIRAWDFGDGTSAGDDPSPAHAYALPGAYTARLTVADASGARDEAEVEILVLPRPEASATNDGPYASGEAIHLISGGGTTYAWTGPNGFVSEEASPTLPNATAANAGVYTVVVASEGNCTAQAETEVVIDGTPPILSLPPDVRVERGAPMDPEATGWATASDDVDSSPVVAYADDVDSSSGSIRRAWTATDAVGNRAEGIQTITVFDPVPPGEIRVALFVDTNENGAKDLGEEEVGGVALLLDHEETVLTGPDGEALFAEVPPGGYEVAVSPEGDATLRALGLEPPAQAQVKVLPGETAEVTLPVREAPGTIEGVVYADQNGNGAYDAGERAVPRVAVRLDDGREVLTNGDGEFSFLDVRPGEHQLTATDPRGAPLVKDVLLVRGGEAWAEILWPSAARTGGFLTVELRMDGTK
jgi:PKD repeat protein